MRAWSASCLQTAPRAPSLLWQIAEKLEALAGKPRSTTQRRLDGRARQRSRAPPPQPPPEVHQAPECDPGQTGVGDERDPLAGLQPRRRFSAVRARLRLSAVVAERLGLDPVPVRAAPSSSGVLAEHQTWPHQLTQLPQGHVLEDSRIGIARRQAAASASSAPRTHCSPPPRSGRPVSRAPLDDLHRQRGPRLRPLSPGAAISTPTGPGTRTPRHRPHQPTTTSLPKMLAKEPNHSAEQVGSDPRRERLDRGLVASLRRPTRGSRIRAFPTASPARGLQHSRATASRWPRPAAPVPDRARAIRDDDDMPELGESTPPRTTPPPTPVPSMTSPGSSTRSRRPASTRPARPKSSRRSRPAGGEAEPLCVRSSSATFWLLTEPSDLPVAAVEITDGIPNRSRRRARRRAARSPRRPRATPPRVCGRWLVLLAPAGSRGLDRSRRESSCRRNRHR